MVSKTIMVDTKRLYFPTIPTDVSAIHRSGDREWEIESKIYSEREERDIYRERERERERERDRDEQLDWNWNVD